MTMNKFFSTRMKSTRSMKRHQKGIKPLTYFNLLCLNYKLYYLYENMKYSENEELTNALAQIYYAVDNSKSNVSNNQDVIPKREATKSNEDDTNVPNKITGNNNLLLENGNNRSRSRRDLQDLESDYAIPHKRKKIMYNEDDYPSYGGGKRCAL